MELTLAFFLLLLGGWLVKAAEQGRRVALLASHLRHYRIERHMQALTQGYLRALGAGEAQGSAAAWELLRPVEDALCAEFGRFAADFARIDAAQARVSTLPVWLPFALTLAPRASFDMRDALALHARGICSAIRQAPSTSPRERAFAISAELFLMQHTCHWFCKSRRVASSRLLARHQTSYEQVLDAVLPQTRAEYAALVGR